MKIKYTHLFFASCLFTCMNVHAQEKISLAGTWKFQADPSGTGIQHNWQDSSFIEAVRLPGSMEGNKKGTYVQKPSSSFLNQTWQYIGAAWYQQEIEIPASWKKKQVKLFLERTKVTQVWVDDQLIGRSTLLSAPQVYDLGEKLTPGKHRLTIMVDNSPKLVSVGGSHALSEHTQTNWNGIIGKMYLEAAGQLKINWIKVTPDVKNKAAQVRLSLRNRHPSTQKIIVEINTSSGKEQVKKQFRVAVNQGDTVLQLACPLGENALLWSEYTPSVYHLTVNLLNKKHVRHSKSTSFGLREFKTSGTQFSINNTITFLRGKNDGCIFPLTGYPPMETEEWRRLYRIAKTYGINHYRFHSYTPPEAAFEAADLEGIYIQCELPNWANFTLKDTFHTNFQYREGKAILDAYGNHPSFVMFSLGNELEGERSIHEKMVHDLRAHDNRRLYAFGTNAFFADPKPGAADDFWVTMRTGKESPGRESDVRGSFATTEDSSNGILNTMPPSTRRNFSSALKGVQLPVIGHEIGQYQVYPDYTEIPKYTGTLRPLNFEIFRKRLQDAGMGDQAVDFFKASGNLSALLYREEIEMAFRTPGFAGFQLLDLQDFPGQGTALVGMLNAFMENKGLITAETFRRFNNDVVLLLLMDKYVWTNNETFTADVQLVNYSPKPLTDNISWTISNAATTQQLSSGKGRLSFPLHNISKATKLLVKLQMPGTAYENEYPVWVYPAQVNTSSTSVKIATALDDHTIEILNKGGKVLLFPDHQSIKDKSIRPQFIAEFWNWLVFKGGAERNKRPVSAGTLGILTDPTHPLFNSFPTEFHTNWQWWAITKNARPLILDKTEKDYRPIVQVIDNIDRNHKLGMIFEFKVGKGSLLVSMVNLPAMANRPEARQLYGSILRYMESGDFRPNRMISNIALRELL